MMDHVGTPETTFVLSHGKYNYNVMSFELNNACVTYQRHVDVFFSKQTRRNMVVYIDDVSIKTSEGKVMLKIHMTS